MTKPAACFYITCTEGPSAKTLSSLTTFCHKTHKMTLYTIREEKIGFMVIIKGTITIQIVVKDQKTINKTQSVLVIIFHNFNSY